MWFRPKPKPPVAPPGDQDFKKPCSNKYSPAYHQSGTRPTSAIRNIVMHSTESPDGSAAAIGAYFKSPSSGGSAHLVVDSDNCFRCLPSTIVPWGAPGCNTQGYHIEQCGRAAWRRGSLKTHQSKTALYWFAHRKELRRSAFKAAQACKSFGIPPVFVTYKGLKRGDKGITTHAEVSKAFHLSTHTDPGLGWPRPYFMYLVKKYLRGM